MAKGLSNRKQKRNKSTAIEDLRKLTAIRRFKNPRRKKKTVEIDKALKEFKFSQVPTEIEKLNKRETKQNQSNKKPYERLDNEQSQQNTNTSVDSIILISDDDVERAPIQTKRPKISEDCRTNDADVDIFESVDNDAEYFAVSRSDRGIIGLLLLRNSKEVAVHGKLQLEVLKGRINILGYDLSSVDGPVPVYSSHLSAIFGIKESIDKNEGDNLNEVIYEELEDIYGDIWASIKEKIESYTTVSLFRKLVSLEMDFMCRYRSYETIFTDPPKVVSSRTEREAMINVTNWSGVTDEIINVLSSVKNTSAFRVLLCGNKNTGKSTYARYLINSILSRSSKTVFFLECDVGQTEFTPSGIISLTRVDKPLLGPPFTHQRDPIASLFFGNNTPKDEPTRYIRCIEQAFQFYLAYHRLEGPLIINTQGWVKGVGLSLLLDTIRLSEPMFVLQFKKAGEDDRGFTPLSHEFLQRQPGWVIESNAGTDDESLDNKTPAQYRIITTRTKHTEHQQFKSVDYRKLSTLAHFSHMFTDGLVHPRMIERPINCLTPRIVYWKDVAVHVMHSMVPPSMILAAINYSLVSLSIVHPNMIIKLSEEILPNGPKFLRHNPIASHIGFGFVRNIDIGKKAFLILTPLPYDKLINVNALLKGNINVPLELIKTGNFTSERLYCTPKRNAAIRGARERKPRFNLKRKKFVTARRRHETTGLPH